MALSAKDAAAVKKAGLAGGLSSSQANAVVTKTNSGSSSSSSSPVVSSTPVLSTTSSAPASTGLVSKPGTTNTLVPAPSNISIITDPATGQQFSRDTSVSGSIYAPYKAPAASPPTTGTVLSSGIQGLVTPPSFQGTIGAITQASQPSTTQTGLIKNLTTASNTNPLESGGGYDAYSKAVQNLNTLKQKVANEFAAISSEPIPLHFQQGRKQVLAQQYAEQINAAQQAVNEAQQALGYGIQEQQAQLSGLGTALGGANTQQQQQIAGLTSAGTLTQPKLGQSGQQYYNPLTANSSNGSMLPADAQAFVNSLAQQVKNGQMTRADAESRISAYGVAGIQALNTVLGTTFNTNASNASAATTATGQQIQAAIGPATQALDALQKAYDALAPLQQGNIGVGSVPILSNWIQQISTAFGPGREEASAFQGALQEARSRIDAALVGSIGVNAAAAQANALLPDNMIPTELPQKIAAAKAYLQNQLAGYAGSGQQNQTPTTYKEGNLIYSF